MVSKTVGTLGNHYVAVETVDAGHDDDRDEDVVEFHRDTTLPTMLTICVATCWCASLAVRFMEDTADSLRLITTDVDVNNDDVDLCCGPRKLFATPTTAWQSGSGGSIAGTAYNTIEDSARNFTAIGIDENYAFEFINWTTRKRASVDLP